MPGTEASGTQTAVISTEHTLATVSANRMMILMVDAANMVLGDALTLRVKTRVLTGGTTRVAFVGVYQHAQTDDPIKVSIPVGSPFEAIFTLQQTAGTGRAFDWSVLSF